MIKAIGRGVKKERLILWSDMEGMMWPYLTVLLCLQYITYSPQGVNRPDSGCVECPLCIISHMNILISFSSTYQKLLIYMHRLYFCY